MESRPEGEEAEFAKVNFGHWTSGARVEHECETDVHIQICASLVQR